jgi:hypothetical protein
MPGVFGQKQAAHYTRGVVLWQRLLLHNFRIRLQDALGERAPV